MSVVNIHAYVCVCVLVSNVFFSADGTKVPISIAYHKGLFEAQRERGEKIPLILDGYGSYEICNDVAFSVTNLPYLNRGFVIAYAHVRGGGEMGRHWYEDGK